VVISNPLYCAFAFRRSRAAVAKRGLHDCETLVVHALAAILRQEGHERSHLFEVGSVVNEATLLARGHKSRVAQFLEMEG
jgi:hypothetical protein